MRASFNLTDFTKRIHYSVRLVTLFLIIGQSPWAAAETCTLAQAEYLRGNLKGAESILLDVLQLNTSRSEAAICWRLLGIIQFSLGKKTHALNSFEKALAFDDELSLQSTDSLDPKVVPFFEMVKSRRKKSVQQGPPPPSSVPPSSVPPPPTPSPSPSSASALPAPEIFPPSEPDPLFAPDQPTPVENLNDPTVFDPEPPAPPSPSPAARETKTKDDFKLSRSKKQQKKRPSREFDLDLAIAALPFGTGQIYQKRYPLGVLFAAAEAFTLFRFFTIDSEIQTEQNKLQTYIEQNCVSFESSAAGERAREKCVGYSEEQQNYIEELNANKTLFIGAFGALVVVGGAEAIWHELSKDPSESGKKKKKRTRKKKPLFMNLETRVQIMIGSDHPTPYRSKQIHENPLATSLALVRSPGSVASSSPLSTRSLGTNYGLALHWTLTLD